MTDLDMDLILLALVNHLYGSQPHLDHESNLPR